MIRILSQSAPATRLRGTDAPAGYSPRSAGATFFRGVIVALAAEAVAVLLFLAMAAVWVALGCGA